MHAIRVSSLDHAPTMSSTLVAGNKSQSCCAGFPCCGAFNHGTLFVIAAVIWLAGVVGGTADGLRHLHDAVNIGATNKEVVGTLVSSVLCGLLLGYYGFISFAHKNIDRIEKLQLPKWHESFRGRIWFLLLICDCGTVYLFSSVATGSSYTDMVWKLVFSSLDLLISTSLLVSFFIYPYRWRTFMSNTKRLTEPLLNVYNDTEKEEAELTYA